MNGGPRLHDHDSRHGVCRTIHCEDEDRSRVNNQSIVHQIIRDRDRDHVHDHARDHVRDQGHIC